MTRLTGYGVRNLRALRDTKLVDLRPVTVLVGKNSSGKSTFARILPLLKQSCERRKESPLLWYGRLVDFGSFEDALSSNSDESKAIDLLLRFESAHAIFVSRHHRGRLPFKPTGGKAEKTVVDLKLSLISQGEDGRTTWKDVEINIGDIQIKAYRDKSSEAKITVSGTPIAAPSNGRILWSQGAILPLPRLFIKEAKNAGSGAEQSFFTRSADACVGRAEVLSALTSFVHGNTSIETKIEIADRLPIASTKEQFVAHCQSLYFAPDSWKSNIKLQYISDQHINSLRTAIAAYKIESLFEHLDEAIQGFCDGVSYLEPLRATAQRYYRQEEISTDELDAKGLNTAFYLQGLSASERERLNIWLKNEFGFTFSTKSISGHLSLNISTDSSGVYRNLADVGLGYSQLAPVAIQLWAAAHKPPGHHAYVRGLGAHFFRNRPPVSTVVIEQPELHLHPAFQALLGDVFSKSVQIVETENPPHQTMIVAETHSSNLVNRLGELIAKQQLSSDMVQVLVFEQQAETGATSVRTATFNEKGILQNWPIGFFDY